jgi:hypothetical protein
MALQIKINLPNNSTKTFKFPPDISVAEVIKEIQAKTELGGADHGLYQRATKGKKARWLQPNRTLRFYDIISNVGVRCFDLRVALILHIHSRNFSERGGWIGNLSLTHLFLVITLSYMNSSDRLERARLQKEESSTSNLSRRWNAQKSDDRRQRARKRYCQNNR